jgi:hypothetical protein
MSLILQTMLSLCVAIDHISNQEMPFATKFGESQCWPRSNNPLFDSYRAKAVIPKEAYSRENIESLLFFRPVCVEQQAASIRRPHYPSNTLPFLRSEGSFRSIFDTQLCYTPLITFSAGRSNGANDHPSIGRPGWELVRLIQRTRGDPAFARAVRIGNHHCDFSLAEVPARESNLVPVRREREVCARVVKTC